MQGWFPADQVFVEEMSLLGELWQIPQVLFFQRLHGWTKDWQDRQTRRGEAVWFDPANKHRLLMPGLKLFKEQLAAVTLMPMPLESRVRRYWDLAAYACLKTRRLIVSGSLIGRVAQEIRWAMEKTPQIQQTDDHLQPVKETL
jgi:hypothetical protein